MSNKFRFFILVFALASLMLASTGYSYQILVRPQEAIVEPGAGLKFEAQVFNESHTPIVVEKYEWKVVPGDLGKITDDGYFMAGRKPGRGEVIAIAIVGGQRIAGTAHVIVGAPPEAEIKIDVKPDRAIVPPNGKQAFKVFAKSSKGISLRVRNVRWMVEPKELGKIDHNGLFQAGARIGMGKVIAMVEIDHQVYVGKAVVIVSPPPSAALSGTVLDEFGAALGEVNVSATRIGTPEFSRRVLSADDGSYVLDKLIPGYYIVRAAIKGYVPEYYNNVYYLNEATPVQLAANDSLSGIDFSLNKGGSISGQVTSSVDDTPLEGAHVAAFLLVNPKHKVHILTDEDGNYKLEGLHTGSYVVLSDKAGYLGEFYDDVKRVSDATLVQVEEPNESAGIDFALDMTSAITGVITNDADGSPIANAVVNVRTLLSPRPIQWGHNRVGKTNARGEYAVQVPPGFYLVKAGAQGFAPEWFDNAEKPTEATPVQVFEDQHTTVDMALAPLGSVTGIVVDAETGEPLVGAKVNAFVEQKRQHRHFKTMTDSLGMYTFPGLPAGDYIITAHARDYLCEFWQEADSLKNATLLTVENGAIITDINFTLTKGGVISGIVTSSEDETPIMDAIVTLKKQASHFKVKVRTNENGEFEIRGLQSGTYIASANARGFMKQWYLNADTKEDATPIELVAPDAVNDINFALNMSETSDTGITGIVIDDSTGLPIDGAMVAIIPLTFAQPRRALTGPDGTFEILGVKPGKYLALARAEGYIGEFYNDVHRWFKATPIKVVRDQMTLGIDFGLAPREEGAYMITGTIVDPSGAPVDGALIIAEDNGEIVAAEMSDADGSYELDNIPAGTYKLSASMVSYNDGYYDGESAETSQAVSVGNGENVYDASITLNATTTGLSDNASVPASFSLHQNYPNPFNPTTEIRFSLPKTANVKLTVFNVLGKEVKTLFQGRKQAGAFVMAWDGTNNLGVRMSSGVYIYRLEADANGERFVQTRRMLMLK